MVFIQLFQLYCIDVNSSGFVLLAFCSLAELQRIRGEEHAALAREKSNALQQGLDCTVTISDRFDDDDDVDADEEYLPSSSAGTVSMRVRKAECV